MSKAEAAIVATMATIDPYDPTLTDGQRRSAQVLLLNLERRARTLAAKSAKRR